MPTCKALETVKNVHWNLHVIRHRRISGEFFHDLFKG